MHSRRQTRRTINRLQHRTSAALTIGATDQNNRAIKTNV